MHCVSILDSTTANQIYSQQAFLNYSSVDVDLARLELIQIDFTFGGYSLQLVCIESIFSVASSLITSELVPG